MGFLASRRTGRLCVALWLGLGIAAAAGAAPQDDDTLDLGLRSPGLFTPSAPVAPDYTRARVAGDLAVFDFSLPEDVYVYRDSLQLSAPDGVEFVPEPLPPGEVADYAPADMPVLTGTFSIGSRLRRTAPHAALTLHWQACRRSGICLPGQELSVTLPDTLPEIEPLPPAEAGGTASAPAPAADAFPASGVWAWLLCLLLGAGLNLTPCVLPLLPVYAAMLAGQQGLTFRRKLARHGAYLAGLTLTFTVTGLLCSALGMDAHAYLQAPAVSIGLGGVLMLLAANCLGLYRITVPARWLDAVQQRLTASRTRPATFAFLFGALSAVLTTPCTAAPLAGVLLVIVRHGDLVTGTLMLGLMGLGMGLPLCAVGLLGSRLPRLPATVGISARRLLALPLLWAAIYVTEHLYPAQRVAVITAAAALSCLYAGFCLLPWWPGRRRRLGVIAAAALAAAWVAVSLPRALSDPAGMPDYFRPIATTADLERYRGRPVLLTFSASWCHNCHAQDAQIYARPEFRAALGNLPALRADLSDARSPDARALAARFQVFGVPAAYVLGPDGKILRELIGYRRDLQPYLDLVAPARN